MVQTGGVAVLLAAAAMLASLATWHVNDPSFSYAAEAPARNLLGRPGAARGWFRRALELNPHFSLLWAPVARRFA